MARFRPIVSVAVGRGPSAPVVSGSRVFVSNAADGTVSAIDPSTNTVVATIPVGVSPGTPLSSSERLYVPLTGEWKVAVIDTTALSLLTTIPVENGPVTPVMASAGSVLVVPNSASGSVSLINPLSGLPISTLPVGGQPGMPAVGTGNQYASYLDRVFIPNATTNSVSIVDVKTGQVVSSAAVGVAPGEPAVSPPVSGTTLVYVPNAGSGSLTILDQADGRTVATVPAGAGPVHPSTNADGSLVFVPNAGSGTVTVVNSANSTVVRTLRVGRNPGPGTASVDGRTIYVPNRDSGSIAVLNAAAGTLTATLNVGPQPTTPAIYGTRLFVSSSSQGVLRTVDLSRRLWPTAPRSVRAKGLTRGALVTWRVPSSPGPASIRSYITTASTGQTCRSVAPRCRFSKLPKGARVSFEVRAVTSLATGQASVVGPVRVR